MTGGTGVTGMTGVTGGGETGGTVEGEVVLPSSVPPVVVAGSALATMKRLPGVVIAVGGRLEKVWP